MFHLCRLEKSFIHFLSQFFTLQLIFIVFGAFAGKIYSSFGMPSVCIKYERAAILFLSVAEKRGFPLAPAPFFSLILSISGLCTDYICRFQRDKPQPPGWCDIEYSSRVDIRAVGEWTSKENFADLSQREEHRRRAPPVHLWSISYMFTPLLIYYFASDELWICHAWCLTSSSKNRFSLHPGARNTETRGKVFTVLSSPITSYG